MKSYKELLVWQKSKLVAIKIYKSTSEFPKEEMYGLISQMRRCSVSVPSNIAEGWGRNTDGNFVNFLNIAKGSLCELETQLLIANELGYISLIQTNQLELEINEVLKMLVSLINTISKKNNIFF